MSKFADSEVAFRGNSQDVRLSRDWPNRSNEPSRVGSRAEARVSKGKTPVLTADEARQLLDSIDVDMMSGLRDRALIGLMVYSFDRVSAAVGMNVNDYFPQRLGMWFRFVEIGSKSHDVPAHHNAESDVPSLDELEKIQI